MLAEFLDRIVGLAKGAHRVEFAIHEKLPRRVFVRNGDQLTQHDEPPPDRCHSLIGFDDLVEALRDKTIAPAPEVYVCGSEIEVLLDRTKRVEVVKVCLNWSKRFLLCQAIEKQPRALTPKDAVKLLRYELHSGNVEHVIQALSRIDFTRTSAGKSHVEHGRETLGRSVEAAVQQAESVPKDFVIAVPLWTNPGFHVHSANVAFGIYLDLEAQLVELRVLSDECLRVSNLAVESVIGRLREGLPGVPVFHGVA